MSVHFGTHYRVFMEPNLRKQAAEKYEKRFAEKTILAEIDANLDIHKGDYVDIYTDTLPGQHLTLRQEKEALAVESLAEPLFSIKFSTAMDSFNEGFSSLMQGKHPLNGFVLVNTKQQKQQSVMNTDIPL